LLEDQIKGQAKRGRTKKGRTGALAANYLRGIKTKVMQRRRKAKLNQQIGFSPKKKIKEKREC